MTVTIESSAQLNKIESDDDPPRPFQIKSHEDLLQFPRIPATSKVTPSGKRPISVPVVDAILVPTFRSAEQIRTAVELASRARCRLLTLYTNDFPPGLPDVLAGIGQGEATPLVLLSDLRDYHLLDLGAHLPQTFTSPGALDISRKRNLGLLIGRMRGWTRMLLLDDDIGRLSIEKLSAAAALLDRYPVVGFQVSKFQDASVVGHARRRTGWRQKPFVSGGSLLVDPQRLDGFFPAIYHEDWLCVINHLRAGEVAVGGTVGQLRYNPFAFPGRAKNEEFGDIFLSGLLWLIHARKGTSVVAPAPSTVSEADCWREVTEPQFWTQILEERAALLENVAQRLEAQHPDNPHAQRSLGVARQRCSELTPDEFASVAKTWLSNLDVWRERVSSLPRVDSVEKALVELGISNIVRPYRTGPQLVPAASAGRWQAKAFTMPAAALLGLLGAALSVLKTIRHRARK